MATNSRQEDDSAIYDSDMSWCLCSHCIHGQNIEEKICCKNPLILPNAKFNESDCITLTEVFNNVCLNKDVLQAAMGAWRDFNNTDLALTNINYRFISYKQYTWWTYGYLGKKNRRPLPNCVLKKIRAEFPEKEGHVYVPYVDVTI